MNDSEAPAWERTSWVRVGYGMTVHIATLVAVGILAAVAGLMALFGVAGGAAHVALVDLAPGGFASPFVLGTIGALGVALLPTSVAYATAPLTHSPMPWRAGTAAAFGIWACSTPSHEAVGVAGALLILLAHNENLRFVRALCGFLDAHEPGAALDRSGRVFWVGLACSLATLVAFDFGWSPPHAIGVAALTVPLAGATVYATCVAIGALTRVRAVLRRPTIT